MTDCTPRDEQKTRLRAAHNGNRAKAGGGPAAVPVGRSDALSLAVSVSVACAY